MIAGSTETPKATLGQRIFTLRWAVPLALAAIAFFYQLGPAHWVNNRIGQEFHYIVEISFYATTGPLLAYWSLTRIGHWVEEKQRAERQARTSQQRLASITNASADAILSIGSAGRIELWNRGAELLFGYQSKDILGHPISFLLGGAGSAEVEYDWLMESLGADGFITSHETTCRDAAGREVPVELTATRIFGIDGEGPGVSVILRDITERKRREDEIYQLNASLREQVAVRTKELAEKVKALARANEDLQKLDQLRSEFVSVVSHQIRAPLTNIHGAMDLMQAHCGSMDETCIRMVDVVNQQVDRLNRLVSDVLSAARIESGELILHIEPVSVLPVAAQAVEHFRARRSGRKFIIPVKPGMPPAMADRDQLAEVLTNLLDNADKYSPPGTSVEVEIRADQREITLSVRDNGPGLPSGDMERIFEKHYRVDNSDSQAAYGYGLGLYVCRRLIEAQGGRIWAENVPQGGARFSFTLPVAP